MGQHLAVELVDDNVQIAIDELAVLAGKCSIGLFRPLLLDEGYGLLDHRDGVVLASAICRRGCASENNHGC